MKEDAHREATGARASGTTHQAKLVAPILVRLRATHVRDEQRSCIAERLVLRRHTPRPARVAVGAEVDPMMLRVFNNRSMAIAEETGTRHADPAHSLNVRAWLDFSRSLRRATSPTIAAVL